MTRTTANKRKLLIAGIAAAALAVGGTSAAAFDSDDGTPDSDNRSSGTTQTGSGDDRDDDRDDADDRDDRDDDRDGDDRDDRDEAKQLAAAKVSAKEAVDKALAAVPGGTVQSVDLDDDDRDGPVWEADVLGKDNKWHELAIDADNGKVLDKHTDRDDDGDDDRDDADDRDDRDDDGSDDD